MKRSRTPLLRRCHDRPTSNRLARRGARRRPAVEPLEGRTLLTATLDASGLLTILGTTKADVMQLKAGPNVGDVALFGVPGVQNGTIVQKVREVKIDALAGDDSVKIEPLGLLQGPQLPNPCFDVGGGPGSDTIEIESLVGAPGYARDYLIDAGAGDNTTRLVFGDGLQGQIPPEAPRIEVQYQSGAGADTLDVQYAGPLEVDFHLTAETGAGDDTVNTRLTPVEVEPPPSAPQPCFDVAIATGAGNDRVDGVLEAFGLIAVPDVAVGIDLGAGHDELVLNAFAAASPNAEGEGMLRLEVRGGSGDDLIAAVLRSDQALPVGSFAWLPVLARIDAGSGDDVVHVFSQTDQVGVTTPDDFQWDVGVKLGAGDDTLIFDLTTPDSLRLDVHAGAGDDHVNMDQVGVTTPDSDIWDVGIDLGAGDDWLYLDVTTPDRIRLDIQAGAGHDDLIVYSAVVGSFSPSTLVADLVIDLGAGDDVAVFVLHGTTPTAGLFRLRMSGGSGDDTLGATLNAHPQGSAVFDAVVAGNAGDDHLALWFLGVADPLRVFALIDGGAGFDTATSSGPVKVVKVEEFLP